MKKFLFVVLLFSAALPCFADKASDSKTDESIKTVKIGDQEWMAENLNRKMGKSWCYADKPENCEKYGRLYDWNTAQKACPAGWHLPSLEEYEKLQLAAGGANVAAVALKSASGWKDGTNGTDALGFSALPGGNREYNGSFAREGEATRFWSSTVDKKNTRSAKALHIYYTSEDALLEYFGKKNGFYVRCVK